MVCPNRLLAQLKRHRSSKFLRHERSRHGQAEQRASEGHYNRLSRRPCQVDRRVDAHALVHYELSIVGVIVKDAKDPVIVLVHVEALAAGLCKTLL